MTPENRIRLLKLLPKLAAVTDQRRLKVLSDIDRVLLAENMTSASIAALLEERTNEYADIGSDEVLAMAEFIAAHNPQGLSDSALNFLRQLREAAGWGAAVSLSARQREWLWKLHHKATIEHEQAAQQAMTSAPLTAALH